MSEKLCLQWNDFKENVHSRFGCLRDDKDFTDMTLACEDGQQMGAHKVILAASSPFFEKILQQNKHPHPLIYLRGFHSQDLSAILDFLYFGEAKVHLENVDVFLLIAEELKLKGLTSSSSSKELEDEEKTSHPKPVRNTKELIVKSTTNNLDNALIPNVKAGEKASRAPAIPLRFSGDLQALDELVKSMMEKSQNMITSGNQLNGTLRNTTASICKVCGREGRPTHIQDHIESYHVEGISIPCDFCGKAFRGRNSFRHHKAKFHK